MSKGYNGSTTPEKIRDIWQTPQFVFNYFESEIDGFDCDVASADDNHFCDRWLTSEDDGLKSEWSHKNWCNPPYSDISSWVDKAIEESKKGRMTLMLLPADTSVKWFRKLYDASARIDFINGRLSFIRADTGIAQGGNNKGSMVAWVGSLWANPGVPYFNLIDRDSMR